jgi:hypothetical protein
MIDPAALPVRDDDESRLAAQLPGTWRVTSWRSFGADGSETAGPLGEDADGIIVYTRDGTMITTLARRDRPPVTGGDLMGGPADERLAAAASFIAYSGGWRLEGDVVVHMVEMSLFPNWVGGEQRRRVELSEDGDHLVLTSGAILVQGIERRQRLTCQRLRR